VVEGLIGDSDCSLLREVAEGGDTLRRVEIERYYHAQPPRRAQAASEVALTPRTRVGFDKSGASIVATTLASWPAMSSC